MTKNNKTLPDGWQWKKLGEICEFSGGSQPPKDEFSHEKLDNYVRLIQIRDYKSDAYIVHVNKNSVRKFCSVDDVMIGRYGPPVFQILRGIEGAYNVALMKAIPKKDILENNYLFWFLQNDKIQTYVTNLSQRSAGQSGVDKVALEKYPLLLPPLAEQKRIVSKIDAAFEQLDEAISLQKTNIARTETLKKALLVEQFSELPYEKKDILEIAKISNKTILPNDDEIYNYVGLENIEKETRKLVDFNPQMGSQIKSNKVFFKKNMVLYGKLRPYLNKVWVANFDGIATTEILPFECKSSMNTYFFTYFLSSPEFVNKVSESTQGSRMPRLRTEFWKEEAQIPLPPLAEQERIVAYLDKSFAEIDAMLEAQRGRLAHLQGMKKAILQEAFEGKI